MEALFLNEKMVDSVLQTLDEADLIVLKDKANLSTSDKEGREKILGNNDYYRYLQSARSFDSDGCEDFNAAFMLF